MNRYVTIKTGVRQLQVGICGTGVNVGFCRFMEPPVLFLKENF